MKERLYHHHSTPDDKPWKEEESSLGQTSNRQLTPKSNFYESITANEQVLRLDVTMNDILQTAH
jgi:hypothetical protein